MSFNELTAEQRQAALDKAKETRAARAAIRADLKAGRLSPAEAVARAGDPVVGRIKVSTFISQASARRRRRKSWPTSASWRTAASPGSAHGNAKPSWSSCDKLSVFAISRG